MTNDFKINDELRDEGKLLNSIPKQNPFAVPDGFFETLPQSINKRIHKGQQPSLLSVLFPKPVRVAFASIAAIALVFAGVLWFNKIETGNIANFDDENYVEEYLLGYMDYNPSGLYQMVYDEDFDFTDANDKSEIDDDDDLFDMFIIYANYHMMSPDQFNGE
ncbi:MAG: hypothetical protein KGZ97_04445 [Bacteroidetes bacterium]|nr:hypothetical protein [Bacteroidota bacterium]